LVHAYLRYADDVLLFDDAKAQLWAWREKITCFSAGLRLRLHERKTVVFPVTDGVDWLGFRLYPTHRRLRRENVRRAYRRLKRQQAAYARGQQLEMLRLYTRLCADEKLKLLRPAQYEEAARRLDEVGRLLGSWIKRTWERAPA